MFLWKISLDSFGYLIVLVIVLVRYLIVLVVSYLLVSCYLLDTKGIWFGLIHVQYEYLYYEDFLYFCLSLENIPRLFWISYSLSYSFIVL